MPYDLNAIERGYGEVDCDWNGHSILLRYRADLNTRGLLAMQRAMVGALTLDGVTRFPDVEAIMNELVRVLLPAGSDVHEDERGWDLTRGDTPLPINLDSLADLEYMLLIKMLSTVFGDISNPNRRKVSRRGSPLEAASQPMPSPTTSESSSEPSATDNTPTPSPTPITSIRTPEPLSLPTTNDHAVGFAGLSGTGS